MGESEVFNKLVKELDPIERKQLLEKLEFSQTYEAEPMIRKAPEEEMDLYMEEIFRFHYHGYLGVMGGRKFFMNKKELCSLIV